MISTYLSCQSAQAFPLNYFGCSIFNDKSRRSFRNCRPASCQIFHRSLFSIPSAKPQWIQAVKDTALAIEERLYWECRANGKPKPSYTWLKNGQQLLSEVNYSPSPATYQYFILKT